MSDTSAQKVLLALAKGGQTFAQLHEKTDLTPQDLQKAITGLITQRNVVAKPRGREIEYLLTGPGNQLLLHLVYTGKLSKNAVKVLHYLGSGESRLEAIKKELSLAETTARTALSELQSCALIESYRDSVGGQRYSLTEKGHRTLARQTQ